MKRRIATELLKLQQSRVIANPSSFALALSQRSYEMVSDMITDVKRPFLNICIHGRNPNLLLPFLQHHNARFSCTSYAVTLVDYVRNLANESLVNSGCGVKQLRYVAGPDHWIPEQNCFDLLVSSLETHHCNDQEELFRKYLRSLKPDGALVGSQLAEGTLSQLYWAYLLAENERYGGMSPKVLTFPGLGETGSRLTAANYQLVTILQEESTLHLPSFLDLLTLLQELGESGYLRGRRKGAFKDMLMSAAALYHSQFQSQAQGGQGEEGVTASLVMSMFIAWKFHQNQPKKLRPGPHVGSVEFSQELGKFGEVQSYEIGEESEPKKSN